MSNIKTLIGPKQLQKFMQIEQVYDGLIDGILGRKSIHGAMTLLDKYGIEMTASWSPERVFIAVAQIMFTHLGFSPGTIDGLLGPNTDRALEEYQNELRGVEAAPDETNNTPTQWPRYRDMEMFYGPVGQNIELYTLPYKMRLAWDKSETVSRISLHRKCAESAIGVLEQARDHYGKRMLQDLRLDLFGGSLNVRKMRGGNKWSTHSWAAAIDIDPAHNQFRWNNYRASLDEEVYEPWWGFWEAQGWVSLGRERNFDWMHVQAVRL